MVRVVSPLIPPGRADPYDDRLLWKPVDAARCLCISPRKLWAMTNAGEIPCVRLGRAVRYDPEDLRRWIEDQKAN